MAAVGIHKNVKCKYSKKINKFAIVWQLADNQEEKIKHDEKDDKKTIKKTTTLVLHLIPECLTSNIADGSVLFILAGFQIEDIWL